MNTTRSPLEAYRRLLSWSKRLGRDIRQEALMAYCRLTTASYEDAYEKYMASTLARWGKGATGKWSEGRRQLSLLVARGLRPEDRVLDIGCGALRAGRHFIDFLEPGNYAGIDVSRDAIETGRASVGDETLHRKRPTLKKTDDLRFDEFTGEPPFDYLVSFGVFTQLVERQVTECFANLHRVLSPDGEFYVDFTTDERSVKRRLSVKSYPYSEETLGRLTSEHGLTMEPVDFEAARYRDSRFGRRSGSPWARYMSLWLVYLRLASMRSI